MASFIFGHSPKSTIVVPAFYAPAHLSTKPGEVSWCGGPDLVITAFGGGLTLDALGKATGHVADIRIADKSGNILLVVRGLNVPLASLTDGFSTAELNGGNDTYSGSERGEEIKAGAGNDTVKAGDGDDTVCGEAGNDCLYGEGGNDCLDGGAGNDAIYGGDGQDKIFGGDGDDKLSGGEGDDLIRGGGGNDLICRDNGVDTLDGGDGDDQMFGGEGDDDMYAGFGHDIMRGGAGADLMFGNGGNDFIDGGDGNDRMYGGDGSDEMYGGFGCDVLNGEGGNDLMFGNGWMDILTGGAGKDTMSGGTERDYFNFDNVSDTGKTAATRDVIVDFQKKLDKIDLWDIDSNSRVAGNQAFIFIENRPFFGYGGEVRYVLQDRAGTVNDRTIVEGDLNGDRKADFQIELYGLHCLTKHDFVL